MKKIFLVCILLFLGNTAYASNVNFFVKKAGMGDQTYHQTLIRVSPHTKLLFQITNFWNSTPTSYIINFPTNAFVDNNEIQSDGTCTTSLSSHTNASFQYQFSWSNWCVSEVEFSYTPILPGNYTIGILEGNTLIATVNIEVISGNAIEAAISRDLNHNGYIDAYEVVFSQAVSNYDTTFLKVGGYQATYSGNTMSGLIQFPDNIFSSWELPQILATQTVFGNISELLNNSIVEEDGASPRLFDINGNTSFNTLSLLWTGSLVFHFSESLNHELSKNKFQLKDRDNQDISFLLQASQNSSIYTLTPNTPLLSNKNPFTYLVYGVQDWSGNTYSLSGNIIVTANVCSITSVANGSISSFPSCEITCQSGYQKNGNTCTPIATGWGGGWGGWGSIIIPMCRQSELQCVTRNWSQVWQIIPENSCTSSLVNTSCKWENTSPWDTGNEHNNSENVSLFELDGVKNDLLTKSDPKLASTIEEFYQKIKNIPHQEVLMHIDSLQSKYQTLLKQYQDFILHTQIYLISKDQKDLKKAKDSLQEFQTLLAILQNWENTYISKILINNEIIYQTKYTKIRVPLEKLQKVILGKYQKLLSSHTISQEKYQAGRESYNQFVLFLSIYRFEKISLAKKMGKQFAKEVLTLYYKKIIKAPQKVVQMTLGTLYPIEKNISYKDYNTDVENFQKSLKYLGYFPYEPTGYFGDGTLEAAKTFFAQRFWEVFETTLTQAQREKIGNLPYQQK